MNDTKIDAIWAVILIAAGSLIGGYIESGYWVEEAIQHNCAHYDAQTGDFKWNKE